MEAQQPTLSPNFEFLTSCYWYERADSTLLDSSRDSPQHRALVELFHHRLFRTEMAFGVDIFCDFNFCATFRAHRRTPAKSLTCSLTYMSRWTHGTKLDDKRRFDRNLLTPRMRWKVVAFKFKPAVHSFSTHEYLVGFYYDRGFRQAGAG
jgi:hypothetical protein